MVQELIRSLSLVSARSFLTAEDGVENICDYDDNPTSLFLLIEEKAWNDVKKRADLFPEEAKTYVMRHDKEASGGSIGHNPALVKWRLLPIHLAILYSAPPFVIQALLTAYRRGAECYDDERNLPIHLAVKKHANEEIMNLLLAAHPKCIDDENGQRLTPLAMAQRSTSPHKKYYLKALRRGPIYKTVTANILDELLCGVQIPGINN